MIFRQILHPAMGCASYVFGCTGKKALAVVDAHAEHLDEYLAVAAAADAPIVAIIETHVQADHLSGAAALAARTGATIYLHEVAEVSFPHRDLRDGEEIALGNDYVRVLHTPGHSPDSMTLLVGDRVRGEDPWFALTGDTLFVGDAGRPDLGALEGAGDAANAASTLYDSLQKLLALPDDLEIYPAHFAGSACGRSMSGKPSSTIGFERRFNPALRPRSREEFVAFMLTGLPPAPSEHQRIRQANRAGQVTEPVPAGN
jgi:glyoxylase-like metal-dependent hydrolase (beta-lactamase superfamily II)